MTESNSVPPGELDRKALAQFGEPEAEFRPTTGQTLAGIIVGTALACVCYWAVLTVELQPLGQVLTACGGLGATGFIYWVYRLRRWRLMICPRGIIQVRAWAVDAVAWSRVREVVENRVEGHQKPYEVAVVVDSGRMNVAPFNCPRDRVFSTLLEAAKQRNIPIRIEWTEIDP